MLEKDLTSTAQVNKGLYGVTDFTNLEIAGHAPHEVGAA